MCKYTMFGDWKIHIFPVNGNHGYAKYINYKKLAIIGYYNPDLLTCIPFVQNKMINTWITRLISMCIAQQMYEDRLWDLIFVALIDIGFTVVFFLSFNGPDPLVYWHEYHQVNSL